MTKVPRFGPGAASSSASPSLQSAIAAAVDRARRPGRFDYRHALSFPLPGLLSTGGGNGGGGVDEDAVETSSDQLTLFRTRLAVPSAADAPDNVVTLDIPGYGAAAWGWFKLGCKRTARFKGYSANIIYDGSAVRDTKHGMLTLPSGGGDTTEVAVALSISSGKLRLTITNNHVTDAATLVVDFVRGRTF